MGCGAAFFLVNPLASLEAPVNLAAFIWPYSAMLVLRALAWGGEMVPKLGHMVNAINQEGHVLGAALRGPVPLHVLDTQLLRGGKKEKKRTKEKNIDLKILSY